MNHLMRNNKLMITLCLILGLQFVMNGQNSEEMFTVYLIRHAEKAVSEDKPKDPPLTKCGEQRAASLAVFLRDVELDAIYSTDYERTRSTAQPTARDKKQELTLYDPRQLEDFADLLLEKKQDVLVVGHSNTTPTLAGLLAGEALEALDESIYDRIYQVVIHKKNGSLQVFNSAFLCQD